MTLARAIVLLALVLSFRAEAADTGQLRALDAIRYAPAQAVDSGSAQGLHANGPGTWFSSIDAAAIDALTYALQEARESKDTASMRGGTIYPVEGGYSYADIQHASSVHPHRISYRFGAQEVARFHVYPIGRDLLVNRANERLSRADRRSVEIVDPLHRTLYVLHPSLEIRAYRGEDAQPTMVGNLCQPKRAALFAGN